MQQVVTREITIKGAYGFNDDFARSIEAISSGLMPVASLVEQQAALEDGPRIIHDLADGSLDAVKVILHVPGDRSRA
jgi:L-iditol 2-dehydrogenase